MKPVSIRWTLNGRAMRFAGDPEMPLLWHLRDELGLTGTKYGCGIGACGACTVHVDGRAEKACTTRMAALGGRAVVSIEGLAQGQSHSLHPVQQAWIEQNVPQCGYCQAGQMMTAAALLARHRAPSAEQVRAAMDSVLCRCGTYARIEKAVARAAQINAERHT